MRLLGSANGPLAGWWLWQGTDLYAWTPESPQPAYNGRSDFIFQRPLLADSSSLLTTQADVSFPENGKRVLTGEF
jgi:hypothetical protein